MLLYGVIRFLDDVILMKDLLFNSNQRCDLQIKILTYWTDFHQSENSLPVVLLEFGLTSLFDRSFSCQN